MVFLFEDSRQKTLELIEYIKKYVSENFAKASVYGLYKKGYDYQHYFSPKLSTAYCHPDGDRRYKIVIGMLKDYENILITDEDKKKANEALLFHELGHTLYTTDDNKKLNEMIQEYGIPRSFWNLAEDARIEHLIRMHFIKNHNKLYRFEFYKFLKTPKISNSTSPEELLFAYINTENTQRFNHPLDSKVYDFYTRFISAKDSFEVVEICSDWKNYFHLKDNMGLQQSIQSLMQMLSEMNSMESEGEKNEVNPIASIRFGDTDTEGNEEFQQALMENSINMDDIQELEMSLSMDAQEIVDNTLPSNRTVKLESTVENIFDENKANIDKLDKMEIKKVEKIIRKIKSEAIKKTPSNNPSSRLNVNRIARAITDPNSGKLYKKKIRNKMNNLDNKNIKIFLDISGSMSGRPEQFQKTFLVALNKIAKENSSFSVTVTASRSETEALLQTIKLPINEKKLIGYVCNGAEGLQSNLEYIASSNPSSLKNADMVLFITDGYFYDGRLDRTLINQMVSNKTKIVALYYGYNFNEDAKDIFDDVIKGESVVETVELLVDYINKPKKASVSFKNSKEERSRIKPKM